MFSFLCPNQFRTVPDEPLYKGLSSNEYLRGRIRKLSPLSFIFFNSISSSYLLSILFLTFFALLSFFSNGSMAKGGPFDNTGEIGSQFQVNYLPKLIL